MRRVLTLAAIAATVAKHTHRSTIRSPTIICLTRTGLCASGRNCPGNDLAGDHRHYGGSRWEPLGSRSLQREFLRRPNGAGGVGLQFVGQACGQLGIGAIQFSSWLHAGQGRKRLDYRRSNRGRQREPGFQVHQGRRASDDPWKGGRKGKRSRRLRSAHFDRDRSQWRRIRGGGSFAAGCDVFQFQTKLAATLRFDFNDATRGNTSRGRQQFHESCRRRHCRALSPRILRPSYS